MDKKYNTEYGTLIDQRSPHQLSEVFLRLEFIPEPKYSIWVLLLEPLFLMFLILLALKVSFMQFNSLTELVEI